MSDTLPPMFEPVSEPMPKKLRPPHGRGLRRAMKRLERLKSRGVRRRTLERQAMRVKRLLADYQRRWMLRLRAANADLLKVEAPDGSPEAATPTSGGPP